MKVAFLIDAYVHPRAGTERQLWLLVNGLCERGHEAELGVLRPTSFSEASEFPCPIVTLGVRSVLSVRGWWRLHRWGRSLRSRGFRVVQIYFNDASMLGPTALKLAGLKIAVSRRDMGFWYSRAGIALLRLSSWAVDTVVANSLAAGRAACRAEWIRRSKLHIIHNGIPPLASSRETGSATARQRIGIVANVRPIKRIDDLVRAFAVALEHVPSAELVIVGGGDTAALEQFAAELGIAERVRFTGATDDAAAWISTFDVGVICSESEGLSSALLEYMQHGKPVVATRTGGNPEVVRDGEEGLLVPVGDVALLAEALVRLLSNPDEARRLGAAADARVESEFSLDAMIETQLELFGRLSGESPATGAPSGSRVRPEGQASP